MSSIPVLTVIYHENEAHFKMALKAWDSFPASCEITAVINKKLEGADYPKNIRYIQNDENCLSKAWNIGLKDLFRKYSSVIVSGLDSLAPEEEVMLQMCALAETGKTVGLVGCVSTPPRREGITSKVVHGDGTFSFFAISRNTFQKVGDFNEEFKPAYFEDCDYLERMWKCKYEPIKVFSTKYHHVFQGTVKLGQEIGKKYPEFMNRNLELFRKIYGKTPDHLPEGITFR